MSRCVRGKRGRRRKAVLHLASKVALGSKGGRETSETLEQLKVYRLLLVLSDIAPKSLV